MEELNQLAISKSLGSKIREIGPVGFGNFRLRQTTEEIEQALRNADSCDEPTSFSYEEDELIVRAFEDVRGGASTDELLWNKELARNFFRKCHEVGLKASDAYFIRRLINVRKNSPRYKLRSFN